jgi:small-conductance mechanosensitive channel
MDPRVTIETIAEIFIRQVLPGILGAVAIVIGGIIALRILTRAIGAAMRRARIKPALIDLTLAALNGSGWILIAAGILQSLGLNQIALAVGGSISLVALGIAGAAAGNLGDIIAGVFLASDPDFGTGFTIKSKEISGVIERIDLRKTRIRGADGKLHIVPNKMIENEVWIVENRPPAPPPLIQRGRHRTDAEANDSIA